MLTRPKISPLPREEWDFSEVPDEELIACCFWEYARESDFIRDVRQRGLNDWRCAAPRDEQLHQDLQKIQSMGHASEIFMRGWGHAPRVTYQSHDDTAENYRHREAPPISGNFPDPWQTLSGAEKRYRGRCAKHGTGITCKAIERGEGFEAEDIGKFYRAKLDEVLAAFHEVQRQNPGRSEVQLIEEGKLLPWREIIPSLHWESGREATVLRIDWAGYTNDQLVQHFREWVKANRPADVPVPSDKGRKPGDWRAHLTRLAAMRLLGEFKPAELFDSRCGATRVVWETKQFARRKWLDGTKWHDARREAGRIFSQMFPFLSPMEKPRSWSRKPPDK